MKKYDYLIIGAGSAGCNMAYRFKKNGKKVAIVDNEGIAKGASGAAGAFLSPLPGKENLYNTFVNNSLEFSLNFYEKLSPESIKKNGVLRVTNDNFSDDKLQTNNIKNRYISTDELQKISENFTKIDGYFYENAAILDPLKVCTKLIEGCDFYNKDIKELFHDGNCYNLEDIKADSIVLAQGAIKSLVSIPYIKISPIFGVKIDVKTTTKIPFNIHKSISISTNKNDETVAIGATKERHDTTEMECLTTCDKCSFNPNSQQEQVETLLSLADELIKLDNLEVVNIYKGARATIKSYFPVIGKVIDYEKSIKKYPSIQNGTKIPPQMLEYFPNLYIINALGSRGFVVAPLLAKLLCEEILESKKIPKELSSEKLFYKMARSKICISTVL
ncbi:FAD-dependent oxidoreductase [Sulfurimonas sp.]|uniref:FAD-dependent oxidoreductase n=1 Tax=Sulfurimonas sp. TaxID=2022749 RepID=UPI0025FC7724|nr:FAD-dependent oxidoreductase [Sulfurimonas sp.]MDD5156773.1 FAD-dependent oxidoreductase [Sulfurimonas sp.]